MTLPLLSHSQKRQTDIERKDQNSWIISNDAAQAHFYLTVERDNLKKENIALRAAIDSLQQRNESLIQKLEDYSSVQKELIDLQNFYLDQQKKKNEDYSESTNRINSYFKRLADGSHLSGVISVDVKNLNNISFSPFISVPISNDFSAVFIPTFKVDEKPIYLTGIRYSFW